MQSLIVVTSEIKVDGIAQFPLNHLAPQSFAGNPGNRTFLWGSEAKHTASARHRCEDRSVEHRIDLLVIRTAEAFSRRGNSPIEPEYILRTL